MSDGEGSANFWRARAPRVTLAMACVYAVLGVTLPFLPRWLAVEHGLKGAEIGAVMSLAQLARLGTGPLLGMWADRLADRRVALRVLGLVALAAYAAFFFLAHDFWSLLAVGFVALTASQAIAPFSEAALLRATAQGRISYGAARSVGSMAYIVANVAGGALIARFGLGAVVVWTLTWLALFAASAWGAVQRDPAPAHIGDAPRSRFGGLSELLSNRRFVILILACGAIQGAHAFFYSFSSLTWREQGLSSENVGLLWAFGTFAEVLFFLSLPLIEPLVAPEVLILIGGLGAVVRWTLLGFAPLGWALWPLQGMHALSFAASHIGAMRLLFREIPERFAGLAQSIYGAFTSGVFMGVATLVSGVLYDSFGARGYWAMAALAGAGALIGLLLLPRGAVPSRAGRVGAP